MSTPAGIRFAEKQGLPELWLMIWKEVTKIIEKEYHDFDPRRGLGGPPFYSRPHPLLWEDPRRQQAKLAFAASYSTALQAYGPELYEHVVLISFGAVQSLLDCAVKANLRPIQPGTDRALWVKHVDLIITDKESDKATWEATKHAWSGFHHLETLTICYYTKEPSPLTPYVPIAAHLPPSLQLLRLRPWAEVYGEAPKFPQKLRGGKNGKILGRQDFWWRDTWAKQVKAFQTVPNIHLQAVVYVVWPPHSQQAAEEVFRPWTAEVNGGRLHNISVTLFPPDDEGLDIRKAVRRFEGDILTEGKRYGYFPQHAQDLDELLPNFYAYDWRIGGEGNWEVNMRGDKARYWARDYGTFSYIVADRFDEKKKWGWYSSMQ